MFDDIFSVEQGGRWVYDVPLPFEALVARTHRHGMKVIIDIVPNHVARGYESMSRPDGVADFGANDDTSVEWTRDKNFYYVVGEDFSVPQSPEGYQPLGIVNGPDLPIGTLFADGFESGDLSAWDQVVE